MAQVKVTIVGLGRLGASFGMALRALNKQPEARHQFTVTGTDRGAGALRAATKAEAIDQDILEMDRAVESADLVILTNALQDTRDVIEAIGPSLKPGAVVMDAAPLKQPSVGWAQKFFHKGKDGKPDAYLVGVTPIVNPLYLGEPGDSIADAHADLFQNGTMILSPALNCPPEAVQLVSDLTELLGVKVHFVDPDEHDGMMAAMEGLPLLVQLALFQSISGAGSWKDMQWLSNPAFFLATFRLSEGSAENLAALMHHNRANLLRRLDSLMESLGTLRETLKENDEELLAEHFDSAMRKYAEWEGSRLSNRYGTEPTAMDEVRGGFSPLGGLFPTFGGRPKKKQGK